MELDAEALAQLAPVARLELRLGGRQRGSERVVDEVEDERRARQAVAEAVQRAQRLEAPGEDAACRAGARRSRGRSRAGRRRSRPPRPRGRRRCPPGPEASSTVRLQRSMTRRPRRRAPDTRRRKWGFSSGAPPVRSRSSTAGCAASSSSTRSAPASPRASVRFGPASTWQWWQARSQRRPTFTWSVVTAPRRRPRPASARWAAKSGVAGTLRGVLRRLGRAEPPGGYRLRRRRSRSRPSPRGTPRSRSAPHSRPLPDCL